jgi:phosphate transport system substrate-binding protein
VILTHQPGDKAWPVTGASFILLHTKAEKPDATRQVLRFYDWAFSHGGQMAGALDYVPMPPSVVQAIHASWKGITDMSGKPLY